MFIGEERLFIRVIWCKLRCIELFFSACSVVQCSCNVFSVHVFSFFCFCCIQENSSVVSPQGLHRAVTSSRLIGAHNPSQSNLVSSPHVPPLKRKVSVPAMMTSHAVSTAPVRKISMINFHSTSHLGVPVFLLTFKLGCTGLWLSLTWCC